MVYTDQIWAKSKCRQFEKNAYNNLAQLAAKNHKVLHLVDACPDVDNKVYVTDNVLTVPHIGLYPEFWGGFSYDPEYLSRPPTKIFNCFINRVCPNRQSWFYQFVRRNLLDIGNVSYLLDYRKMPENCNNKIELNEWIYQQGNHVFEKEHNLFCNRVPYYNFDTDLDQAIMDTKIGIVIETYFDNDKTIAFSEKIFRSLQLPRPFMLYSAIGAVNVLRQFGFDVWDDVVNHNYDTEIDPIKRQMAILDQIEIFKNIDYSQSQLANFEQRCLKNQQLLRLLKTQWPDKLKTVKRQLAL